MTKHQAKKLIDASKHQVFLCTCRASVPFQFALHPWFVCNEQGRVSRWEVLFTPNENEKWGHLHQGYYELFEGIDMFLFRTRWRWRKINVFESVEGVIAQEMTAFIKESANSYPYKKYSLPGPNSNTYVQWVLDQFPKLNIELPSNSFGKNYHR